jgi:colicin import membrane protein
MDAAADDRLAFAPPPQPGLLRAFMLAVLAHLLLFLALTQGLKWQREEQNVVAEAELWAAAPQQAAPREEPVPPTPPVVRAPPQPEPPVVKPRPEPPVVKAPPPEPPARRDADIALEREKEKRELAKRELEKRELEKRELEKRRQAEAERERAERRKLEAAEKKKQEEAARKKEEQAELRAEAKRKEAEQKRKELEARKEQEAREARDAKRLAQLREDNMRRMQGMAGTGAPGSTGSAAQSSGPSASWGARVQARVKPNIVFTDDISGNPKAEVEVRMAPDGTIIGKRLVRSSGVKAWDEAVLRALERTEVLPRDVDGRVPSTVVIDFRPKG